VSFSTIVEDIAHLLQCSHFQAICPVHDHSGSRIDYLEDLVVIFPEQAHVLRWRFSKWFQWGIGIAIEFSKDPSLSFLFCFSFLFADCIEAHALFAFGVFDDPTERFLAGKSGSDAGRVSRELHMPQDLCDAIYLGYGGNDLQ